MIIRVNPKVYQKVNRSISLFGGGVRQLPDGGGIVEFQLTKKNFDLTL